MKPIKNISRRSFVKSIGLASGGLILACNTGVLSDGDSKENSGPVTEFNPNLFVQLNSDGTLILVASRSEMGNGVRTSLPSVIADEMEADWNRVEIRQATGDKKYGDQNTDGSRSIRYLYGTMRQMGATVKAMLLQAAAQKWNVPIEECTAVNHFVKHTSGKKIGFGDLVEIAKTLEVPENVTLKDPKDFNYIGKELPSIDVEAYSNGSALFGMDIRLPNMKFAAVKRCPVTFGKVKSFDKTAALAIPGVIDVVEIPKINRPFGTLGGVAVVATNTWAAFKGRDALEVTWDEGENKVYSSDTYMEDITANLFKGTKVAKDKGNVDKAFKNADKIVESTFHLPHLSHAPMEVPNAVAWVQGDTCEVWAPTQEPQATRSEVTNYLDVPRENVTVNVTFLGGGFGRKSKPDYIVEAVVISKAIDAPVSVVWSREDDIKHGYYHTVSAQNLKAAIDANGKITGWQHKFGLPSITSTFTPGVEYAAGWEIGTASNAPFEIENMKVEIGKAPAHVRIGWLRSVINIPHGFALNVFADECATAAGMDPLEHRLQLIGSDRIEGDENNPYRFSSIRLKNVLKRAAKNAEWGKTLPEGHAYGLGVQYSFLSYVASIVEVSVINGKVKVHNVWTCVDCGIAVNKNTVRSQMEGSAVFGMSLAFYGKITAKDGAIEQGNYDTYKMVRMHQAPKIHVDIVESTEAPSGVGEPGVPVIAPAIVNAIAKATGTYYHNLPLEDHGLI